MKTRLTFLQLAELVLTKADVPLGYKEIWKKAEDMGLLTRVNNTGKTPWESLKAQLYVDIKNNPNSVFFINNKRPTKFFLRKRG